MSKKKLVLALAIATMAVACKEEKKPAEPEIAGPCPGPGIPVRPSVHTLEDGSVLVFVEVAL